jgi:hypothetical protein
MVIISGQLRRDGKWFRPQRPAKFDPGGHFFRHNAAIPNTANSTSTVSQDALCADMR